MKKTVLLYILLALLFGFFVGLSVPFSYSLCTKGCPTPLLQICEHGFLGLDIASITSYRTNSCGDSGIVQGRLGGLLVYAKSAY